MIKSSYFLLKYKLKRINNNGPIKIGQDVLFAQVVHINITLNTTWSTSINVLRFMYYLRFIQNGFCDVKIKKKINAQDLKNLCNICSELHVFGLLLFRILLNQTGLYI